MSYVLYVRMNPPCSQHNPNCHHNSSSVPTSAVFPLNYLEEFVGLLYAYVASSPSCRICPPSVQAQRYLAYTALAPSAYENPPDLLLGMRCARAVKREVCECWRNTDARIVNLLLHSPARCWCYFVVS